MPDCSLFWILHHRETSACKVLLKGAVLFAQPNHFSFFPHFTEFQVLHRNVILLFLYFSALKPLLYLDAFNLLLEIVVKKTGNYWKREDCWERDILFQNSVWIALKELRSREWSKGAPVNHIKSSVLCCTVREDDTKEVLCDSTSGVCQKA